MSPWFKIKLRLIHFLVVAATSYGRKAMIISICFLPFTYLLSVLCGLIFTAEYAKFCAKKAEMLREIDFFLHDGRARVVAAKNYGRKNVAFNYAESLRRVGEEIRPLLLSGTYISGISGSTNFFSFSSDSCHPK